MPQNQRILLVARNSQQYCISLQQAGFSLQQIQQVGGGEEGLRAAAENLYHCLLFEANMADMDGKEFLTKWENIELQLHTARIVMICQQDEKQASGYIDAGAHDYLVIEELTNERLLHTVNNATRQIQMTRQLAAERHQIERLDAELAELRRTVVAPLSNENNAWVNDLPVETASVIDGGMVLQQLQQQAEELTALYEASSVLFKSRNMLELSYQISETIIKEFKHFDCGILLKAKVGNKLVRAVRAGEMVKRPVKDLFLDGPGLVPEAIRTNSTIYAPHVKEHPFYVVGDSTTLSELVIPLRGMNGVLGVFDLQSAEADAFSARDQRVLQMFAERAAAALEVVQLYEEQDQNAAVLEFRVAVRTAEFIQSKDKVEAMLNSMSDAIILFNEFKVIEQINPAFKSMFGYAENDLSRLSLALLFEIPVSQIAAIMRSALDGGNSVRHELSARRKDGSTFIADTIFSPLIHGNLQNKVICTIRDVSLQKQLENELRKALEREKELSEVKSRFTSMVSHEIRTPLAVILSTAAILDIHLEQLTPEKIRDRLKKINVQVGRLTHIMDDVLTISRAEAQGLAFQPAIVNMKALCTTIIEELAHSYPNTDQVTFTTDGTCEGVIADESLIRHIVSNLLSNAMKYSPAGQPIIFDLVSSERDLRLKIQDSGIGIPEDSQKHMFESFHRAKNVGTILGTGLGMAIVKKAVDAHQGTIRFESKEGQGTTFEVVLPIIQYQGKAVDPKDLLLRRN